MLVSSNINEKIMFGGNIAHMAAYVRFFES